MTNLESALAILASESPDPFNAPLWAWALGILTILAVGILSLHRTGSPVAGFMTSMVLMLPLYAALFWTWGENPRAAAYREQVSEACDRLIGGIAKGEIRTLPPRTLETVETRCGRNRVAVAANAPDAVIALVDRDTFSRSVEDLVGGSAEIR